MNSKNIEIMKNSKCSGKVDEKINGDGGGGGGGRRERGGGLEGCHTHEIYQTK